MPLLNSIISWVNVKQLHQIELFKKYPFDVQQDVFKKLVDQAARTTWGLQYAYDSIIRIEDFQQRVPISTYEDTKPYIERLRNGEQNLLWPTDIKWFAKSSGTTSDKSKFIPVSFEALEDCHFRGGKDVIALKKPRGGNTSLPGPLMPRRLSSATSSRFRATIVSSIIVKKPVLTACKNLQGCQVF